MGVGMTTGTGWNFGGPNISLKNAASEAIFQKYSLNFGETLKRPIIMKNLRERSIAKLQAVMAYSNKGKKLNIIQDVASDGHLKWKAPPGGKGYMMNFFSNNLFKMI